MDLPVLGLRGISGWIRKLIKDGVPRSIDRRGESLFIIIDRHVHREVVSCSGKLAETIALFRVKSARSLKVK